VARIAVLISHHFKALPRAVHVIIPGKKRKDAENDPWVQELFRLADSESGQLGYPLKTDFEVDEDVASGFLRAAESSDAQTIVLGHPLTKRAPEFERIVDFVAQRSSCPVVVAKFGRSLAARRILVPVRSLDELAVLSPFCWAMAMVPGEKITIFYLAPGETPQNEMDRIRKQVSKRFSQSDFSRDLEIDVLATDSRLHSILEAARGHDLIIMNAVGQGRLSRVFFGSLAEDVAQRVDETMLLVRAGMEGNVFSAWTEPI
jgi:nucleotide-binding universal stress UspA family protein